MSFTSVMQSISPFYRVYSGSDHGSWLFLPFWSRLPLSLYYLESHTGFLISLLASVLIILYFILNVAAGMLLLKLKSNLLKTIQWLVISQNKMKSLTCPTRLSTRLGYLSDFLPCLFISNCLSQLIVPHSLSSGFLLLLIPLHGILYPNTYTVHSLFQCLLKCHLIRETFFI